jgi:hypothetical protein
MANRPQPIRDPHAALVAARELIAEEGHWTRSAPARRLRPAKGRGKDFNKAEWLPIQSTHPRAGRWCVRYLLCLRRSFSLASR